MDEPEQTTYCPICRRNVPVEVYTDGEYEWTVTIHDDIEHDDDDLEALGMGIQ